MEILELIILAFWCVSAGLLLINYSKYSADLNLSQKIFIFIIFMIGAPFFTISNLLETILSTVVPPGWGEDDDDLGH